MAEDISHPIRKAPKKYPVLLNYEAHQNQETFAYQITWHEPPAKITFQEVCYVFFYINDDLA